MWWDLYNNSIRESEIPELGFNIRDLFTVAVNVVTVIGFGVSFIMLAYSFIQFITSTGDSKRTEKAQKAVTWSVIGMILIALLQGIKYLIKHFLGVEEGSFL